MAKLYIPSILVVLVTLPLAWACGSDSSTSSGDDGNLTSDAGISPLVPAPTDSQDDFDDGEGDDEGAESLDNLPMASADDTALAQRLRAAWNRRQGAKCPCSFMEFGYTTAEECTADATSGEEYPAYTNCVANAVAGQRAVVDCWINAEEAYATCATGTACDMVAGCDTALEAAYDACPEAPTVDAMVEACDGDED